MEENRSLAYALAVSSYGLYTLNCTISSSTAGNAKDILEALEICVSVVVKTLAGEDEGKAGSLVCEFVSHATERMIRDDVKTVEKRGGKKCSKN